MLSNDFLNKEYEIFYMLSCTQCSIPQYSQVPIGPVVYLIGVSEVERVRSQVVDDPATSAFVVDALDPLSACNVEK